MAEIPWYDWGLGVGSDGICPFSSFGGLPQRNRSATFAAAAEVNRFRRFFGSTPQLQAPPMFTYEDSVLDHADEDGCLSQADAEQLLHEHGFTFAHVYADPQGFSTVELNARDAEALLGWLGY